MDAYTIREMYVQDDVIFKYQHQTDYFMKAFEAEFVTSSTETRRVNKEKLIKNEFLSFLKLYKSDRESWCTD